MHYEYTADAVYKNMKTGNFINGRWKKPRTKEIFLDINPANKNEVLEEFFFSGSEEAEEAVFAARKTFESWSASSPVERGKILRRTAYLMQKQKEDLAKTITQEEGKVLMESRQEVNSAIEELEFQAGQATCCVGEVVPSRDKNVFCYTSRKPLGVAAVITPWNFPLNVAARKIGPALVAGNTVIFKPASFTPLTAVKFTQILAESGFPAGVVNLIIGSGNLVGECFSQNPEITAISFTGSTEIGRHIRETSAKHGTKVQLEMGGKNAVVVLEDADLEQATRDISLAAYACSGQWCTSTSRVIVLKPVAKKLTDILVEKARSIVVGPGLDERSRMGPVAGKAQMEGILDYIELARKEGAQMLAGGHQLKEGRLKDGYFIAPTILGNVQPEMRIAKEEIFGPVLSIMTVSSFEEAVELANDVEFGLSSSIFTSSLQKAFEFINRSQTGLVHVNLPTSMKEPQLPFGGIKFSGSGFPEAGKAGIEFFTNHKTIYIKHGKE